MLVHKDWLRRFKYALLWGSGKFGGQRDLDVTTSCPTATLSSFDG